MSNDPYAAVIADLERKRAEIDKLIESLKAYRQASSAPAPIVEKTPEAASTFVAPGIYEFKGKNVADSAKIILERANKPLTNTEILEALKARGYESESAQPLNTVGSIINRRSQQVGDIVRVGRGTWALKEWGLPSEERPGDLASANEDFDSAEAPREPGTIF